MSKGRRESEVQAGVLAYLASRCDLFFWRSNTQAGFAPSGQFMRSGVRGQPDIMCVQAPTGRLFGIEVKRSVGGKVSVDQERWGEALRDVGGVYVVARSVEDVSIALGPMIARVPKRSRRVYHKGTPVCTCYTTRSGVKYICPLCSGSSA